MYMYIQRFLETTLLRFCFYFSILSIYIYLLCLFCVNNIMTQFTYDDNGFWLNFNALIKVLNINENPNKIFMPKLMKAVCMGRRYYLKMESKMEKECPECLLEKHYETKVERPHPICGFYKSHPEEMYNKYFLSAAF